MGITEQLSNEQEISAAKASGVVQAWMSEIADARKREKAYTKTANDAVKLYEGDQSIDYQFNILYSNTETLSPALYNSTPRPVVKRRFNDADPVGKAASTLVQRSLEFFLDSDFRDYPPFDSLMQSAVQQALVPGRGITRFRYDASFVQVQPAPAEVENPGQDAVEPAAEEGAEASYEKVKNETVCGETVAWNRFLHGYAKEWRNVPWVAFEWPMSREELVTNYGEEVVARLDLVDIEAPTGERADNGNTASQTETKGAWVYEIWDKTERKVYFVTESFKDAPLKVVDDPLGLSGFFPCPCPLSFFRRVSGLTPVTLYTFYAAQAKELNTITTRLNKLTTALKIRGMYDSTVDGIGEVIAADDNTLVAAENVAALQNGGSLDKAIWLLPIDSIIVAVQQLSAQRNQIKQVIYEITGIADIMRGASNASETLGAQELKNQWGTLRLKRAQKEVMRYTRDCLRIMAEIAVTKLQPQTLLQMTDLPFPLEVQQQQAQAIAQQLQTAQQPVPPEVSDALKQPSIESILALLNNDLQRSYHIDIETNSTIDAEATEDKQDMAELMNAMSQFLNGVAPAVKEGIMPFDAAKAILIGIVRKFRFGADVEDMLATMQPPPPPEPEKQPAGEDPAVVQAQTQSALAIEKSKQETLAMEGQFKQREHEMKMQELQFKERQAYASHEIKMRELLAPKPAPTQPPRSKR